MNLKILVFIAIGGAIGAVARYLSTHAVALWIAPGFPWGTITVNVVGSFALGALIETFASAWNPSESVRALIVVGILGAFTTFSTFSLDVHALIARGSFLAASGYIIGSVVASIGAFFVGMTLFRHVWS